MNKNKIVWKDGLPCINLGPDEVPRFGPPIPSDMWPEPPLYEIWEFKIEFLQPDFTSLQNQKDQEFFEDLLKELEEFFER